MREIKVIVIDDHPVARQGLLAIFKPDVAIIDIEMSRDTNDGFDIARELRKQGFTGAIVFLTHLDNKYCFGKFLRSGEMGFILKNDSAKVIVDGIKTVASGNAFIST